MPNRPNKICPFPGCKNVVKKGYCLEHKKYETTGFSNKISQSHRWYNTAFWRGSSKKIGLRKQRLKYDDYLCQNCKEKGILKQAEAVDHVIDFLSVKDEERQWTLFSDFENLQSLCYSCHQSKTARTNKFSYKNKK